jgi:CRP/FNR family transcriptional regulator/CRP/FNR family cyclic AMP-dependent transcriptional regulator
VRTLLSRDDFLATLDDHPRAAIILLAIVSRKLQRKNHQVQNVAFLDVPGRIARALLELAAYVGATRESVNKWLGYFVDQG